MVPPAMAKKAKKHPIDTAWFLARIEEKDLSIHAIAPKMSGRNSTLNYASLHLMLHGQRAMSLAEAVQLAEILELPLEDVARRALGKRR